MVVVCGRVVLAMKWSSVDLCLHAANAWPYSDHDPSTSVRLVFADSCLTPRKQNNT